VIGDVMMIGETAGRRRSLGISTAIRNVALGLLIVNSNYPGTPAVAIVLVSGVLSMLVAFAYGKLLADSGTQRSEV
jgi:predicted Na+-dependent transporter